MTTTRPTMRVGLYTEDPIARAGITAELAEYAVTVSSNGDDTDAAVIVADGVDASVERLVRRLRRCGTTGVVLVVPELDDQALFAAVEAGVSGLLRRSEATPDRLAAAVRDATRGHGVMPPDLVGRLLAQVRQLHEHVLAPHGMHLAGMSEREIEVLRLVSEGLGTSEIARKLSYSERTIKNIIQDVTTRLQLRNRSHAVAYALRHGLI